MQMHLHLTPCLVWAVFSGVMMSGDFADLLMTEQVDNNRGLMMICDAFYKHYLTINFSLFWRNLIKIP